MHDAIDVLALWISVLLQHFCDVNRVRGTNQELSSTRPVELLIISFPGLVPDLYLHLLCEAPFLKR